MFHRSIHRCCYFITIGVCVGGKLRLAATYNIRPRRAVYMTVYTAKSMVSKFKRSRSHNGGGRAATADGQAGVAAPPARRLSRGCAALSSAFQGVDRAHPGPRQGSTTGAAGRPRQRFGLSSRPLDGTQCYVLVPRANTAGQRPAEASRAAAPSGKDHRL